MQSILMCTYVYRYLKSYFKSEKNHDGIYHKKAKLSTIFFLIRDFVPSI